ncbi:hypothetical protein [Nitrolancea hollandica]|uniref:DUF559 domain-containing protein n=1 Tax=Nitrolancea hollandica Lb TaxID=1129897 RepID=I4EG11_9BACT|nr:hypothetical protein [Nitrolancea hollandica]CCF83623.1 conserved hypothetical protein [Nitrolancea hollandica Lb]
MSELEDAMAFQIRVMRLPKPAREYRFHPERMWRFDFAWPQHKVALEVEGGTRTGGRHVRGDGFAADCAKYAEAALLGWCVIRVTGEMVHDGTAINYVERAIKNAIRDSASGE